MGTSRFGLGFTRTDEDHPHACGDKRLFYFFHNTNLGSSPRVWGQGINFRNILGKHRIIPTRVGTSCQVIYLPASREDHPHACGDKICCSRRILASTGSSPRVWGQELSKQSSCRLRRIIPTRVGTSDAPASLLQGTQDHPHACGDKTIRSKPRFAVYGSSPRVWGQDFLKSYTV